MALAKSEDYGNDALSVQRLQRKNQVLVTHFLSQCQDVIFLSFLKALFSEVQAHEPIMKAVCETADRLIEDGNESAPRIDERNREIQGKWEELEKALTVRKNRLEDSASAQQVNKINTHGLIY